MADIDRKSSGPAPAGRSPTRSSLLLAGIGVVVVAVVLAVLARQDDPTKVKRTTTTQKDEATSTTQQATTQQATTQQATTQQATTQQATTQQAATQSSAKADAPETAVWPWETSSTRFTDPVDAARSFATDFLGFTAPLVGSLAKGDSRSGEVEVRPRANGPVTTILVRQGRDDSWWVIGAANEHILLEEPEVLDAIRSPVRLRGAALAFEGTVQVHVREDGRRAPLGTGLVTGGGQKLGPFEGTIDFATPTASAGALVLFTESADDGQVWQASVVRVRLASTRR